LHPHREALASQFEPLDDVLPIGSIPFALSPSGLIPSPRFSEFSPSPALIQHLHSILPEYVPSDPVPPLGPESNPDTVKAAAPNENSSGRPPTGGFALPTIPMPAVNLNMDVRNLKWNWPGYLTFGKNSKDKDKGKRKDGKAAGDEQRPEDSEPDSEPDAGGDGGISLGKLVAEGDAPGSDAPIEEEKAGVEVEVNPLSLADAIESEGSHGGSSNEHSPGASTPSEAPPSPAARTIRPIPDDNVTPTAVQSADPVPTFGEGDSEKPQQPTSTGSPSPGSDEKLSPAISEPPPQPVMFSQTSVHLAPPGQPLRTTKRRLYYITVRRH
jgi:hypothetical protein